MTCLQLELLTDTEKCLPAVTFCTQLDKHLVVGSYDQVRLGHHIACEEMYSILSIAFDYEFFVVLFKIEQVLVAASNPPTKYFNFFLTSLLETVRINIGECAAAAYTSLSIAAATQLLMFNRQEVSCSVLIAGKFLMYVFCFRRNFCRQETIEFIAEFYPAWEVDASACEIRVNSNLRAAKSEEIPSLKLISQNLSYATELERIV